MKSFKMARMLVWLLLIVSVLTLPVGAAAEVYVETYMGGVFTPNTDMTINTHGSNPNLPAPNIIDENRHSLLTGQINPAVLGGLKVGTWFVREGFLGYNYPEWMKYLGFYLDLNYHRISFKRQSGASGVNAVPNWPGSVPVSTVVGNQFSAEGNALTLAFMFAARYGFFKDPEVPFGRLQPYVAVGPGLLFSSLRPKLIGNGYTVVDPAGNIYNAPAKGVSPESDYSVNVCLATEAGVRYMALKNVSIDLSFKYRFAQPQYSYDYVDSLGGVANRLHLNPTYNFFSGQLGVAYHF